MSLRVLILTLALLLVGVPALAGELIITGIIHAEYDGGKKLRAIELYCDGYFKFESSTDPTIGTKFHRSVNGAGWTNAWNTFNKTYQNEFVYFVHTEDPNNFREVFGTDGDFANVRTHTSITADGNDSFRIRNAAQSSTIDTVWDKTASNGYLDSWMYRRNATGPNGDYWTNNPGTNNPYWINAGNNGTLTGMTAAQIRAAVPFGTYYRGTPRITGIVNADLGGGKILRAIELYCDGKVNFSDAVHRLHRSVDGAGFTNAWNMFNGSYTNKFVYLTTDPNVFASVFGTAGDFANVKTNAAITADGNDAFRIRDVIAGGTLDQVWYPTADNGYLNSYLYRKDGTGPTTTTTTASVWNAFEWSNIGNDGCLTGLDPNGVKAAVPFGTYDDSSPAQKTLQWKALAAASGVWGSLAANNNWFDDPNYIVWVNGSNAVFGEGDGSFYTVTLGVNDSPRVADMDIQAGANVTIDLAATGTNEIGISDYLRSQAAGAVINTNLSNTGAVNGRPDPEIQIAGPGHELVLNGDIFVREVHSSSDDLVFRRDDTETGIAVITLNGNLQATSSGGVFVTGIVDPNSGLLSSGLVVTANGTVSTSQYLQVQTKGILEIGSTGRVEGDIILRNNGNATAAADLGTVQGNSADTGFWAVSADDYSVIGFCRQQNGGGNFYADNINLEFRVTGNSFNAAREYLLYTRDAADLGRFYGKFKSVSYVNAPAGAVFEIRNQTTNGSAVSALTVPLYVTTTDFDDSGCVNLNDFAYLAARYGLTCTNTTFGDPAAFCDRADLNFDGTVGIADVAIFVGKWLEGCN